MLDFLRRQAKSPVFQVIIVVIVLVFLFWIPKMGSGSSRNSIAVVNGDPIPLSRYNNNYNKMVERVREQFQGKLPSGFIETLGIKDQVLQRLIQDELLLQGAEQMGIHVSNWEIQEQIKHQDFFRTDGVFDKSKYHNILAQNNFTPKKYEESQRIEILGQKATDSLSSFATLTPWEISTRFQYYLNEMKINYGILTPDLFTDQVVLNEDKINGYFEEHKEVYKTAPEMKLSYLSFSLADAMDKIQIDDDAITNYYENNMDTYSTPEQRKARHILLKTDGTNDEKQKTKGEELLKKIKRGSDFSSLAKEFSDDPGSGANGGELGYFSKGQMVPAFETTVFGLDKDQVSELVKTRFGYHIIQVQDIRPAIITPLAEVKTAIATAIKQGQAKGKAFDEASTAYEKIFQAGSLANYAAQENIILNETDFFSQTTPAPEMQGRPKVLAQAFSLNKGELSSMIESHDGYYILYVSDTIEPTVPALASVRVDVVRDCIHAEAVTIARDTAAEILSLAREKGLQPALAAKNIDLQTSPWFSRQQSSGSTLPTNVTTAGLSLSADEKYPEEVLVDGDQFYVIGFAELKVNEATENGQSEAFKQELLQEKQMALLNSWLNHMRVNSKISINREFMGK
jgi:peptidyl-prolyl cis-trans isomerase D